MEHVAVVIIFAFYSFPFLQIVLKHLHDRLRPYVLSVGLKVKNSVLNNYKRKGDEVLNRKSI